MELGPLSSELSGETVDIRAAHNTINIYYSDKLIASYIVSDEEPAA
jgi:transcription termination/antitermination protein NusA